MTIETANLAVAENGILFEQQSSNKYWNINAMPATSQFVSFRMLQMAIPFSEIIYLRNLPTQVKQLTRELPL
jgi:hypothetical protein